MSIRVEPPMTHDGEQAAAVEMNVDRLRRKRKPGRFIPDVQGQAAFILRVVDYRHKGLKDAIKLQYVSWDSQPVPTVSTYSH
jgi:hypothetical protein